MARYALNLPAGLKQEAERLAAEQGVSLNQFILWAVAEKVGSLHQPLDDPRFPHVTYRKGFSGVSQPIIRGTGIRVQTFVIAARNWGETPAKIAEEWGVDEAKVRDALAFYEAHKAEVDALIEGEAALVPERYRVETTLAS